MGGTQLNMEMPPNPRSGSAPLKAWMINFSIHSWWPHGRLCVCGGKPGVQGVVEGAEGWLAGSAKRQRDFAPSPQPLPAYHLDTLQAALAPSLQLEQTSRTPCAVIFGVGTTENSKSSKPANFRIAQIWGHKSVPFTAPAAAAAAAGGGGAVVVAGSSSSGS